MMRLDYRRDKGGSRESHWEATEVNQVRDGGIDQVGSDGVAVAAAVVVAAAMTVDSFRHESRPS